MLRRLIRTVICAGLGIGSFDPPTKARAQTVAPSQVTPQSLRPAEGPADQAIVLPRGAVPAPPAGDLNLTVLLVDVRIEGAFAGLAATGEQLVAGLRGRRVSIAEIYSAAAAVERAYADAGYPLVRLVVPPQQLVDRGALRLVVVDGFIESVGVDGVPARVRGVVAARAASLVGRPHLTRAELERVLLVAGDVPGLKLRSALMRGNGDGGVRLLLDGDHRLVSASAGGDNRLQGSLGTWQLRGALALNSALGMGEQIYGTAGLGADLEAAAAGRSPLTVYGGGIVIPLGPDGLTVNPEYTRSTTRTAQAAGVVASLGTFERYALRLREPISLTRKASLYANVSLEQIDQQISAPDFGLALSHDHYGVFRAGPEFATSLPWGAGIQLGAQFSGGLGGRNVSDAVASGIPLSRLGASPDFSKLSGNVRLSQPLPAGLRIDLMATGQTSFGKPMLRPEQIVLDGSDAASAFASGTFSADQGAVLRSELSRPFAVTTTTVSPYLFGAVGRGWLANATVVEQSAFNVGAVGAGVRGGADAAGYLPGASLALEVARGFTDLRGARQGWRGNLVASVAY